MRFGRFHFLGLCVFFLVLGLGCASKKSPKREEPNFTTPEKTFETWRQAVLRLDFSLLLQCYAVSARPQIERDIQNTSEEGLQQMQRETKQTKFEIQKIVFEENRAYLRILRTRRSVSEVEIINMIKESGLWKIMP